MDQNVHKVGSKLGLQLIYWIKAWIILDQDDNQVGSSNGLTCYSHVIYTPQTGMNPNIAKLMTHPMYKPLKKYGFFTLRKSFFHYFESIKNNPSINLRFKKNILFVKLFEHFFGSYLRKSEVNKKKKKKNSSVFCCHFRGFNDSLNSSGNVLKKWKTIFFIKLLPAFSNSAWKINHYSFVPCHGPFFF